MRVQPREQHLTRTQVRRAVNRMSDPEVYALADDGPTDLIRHVAGQIAHARAVAAAREADR
jgi:hypothetical protein